MIKRFASVLVFFLFAASLAACHPDARSDAAPEVYPETAIVVLLDEAEDLVTVQSSGGILWSFYGCSDYNCGDVVSLLMESNSTPEITDDAVLDARYSGFDAPEFFQSPVTADNIQITDGRFYLAADMKDQDGNIDTYYQFRSNDDTVWWLLTAEEIGFVPQLTTQEYRLVFDNKGTTAEHKPCDCPPENECECEVYDDEFLNLSPVATLDQALQIY